jgi:hypothetical protein
LNAHEPPLDDRPKGDECRWQFLFYLIKRGMMNAITAKRERNITNNTGKNTKDKI